MRTGSREVLFGVAAAFLFAVVLFGAGSAGARGVADTLPPTILGPSSLTVPATMDCLETFCANVTPSFSVSDPDTPSDQVTVSCNYANGPLFFWGMSLVTCQAQDPAGHHSAPFAMTVKVTVPAPTFQNVPGPITTPATGPTGALVAFAPPTASDVGGRAVPVTCDPQGGIAYPIGTTTVTCTATITRNDSNGTPLPAGLLPSGSAQFTVTVTNDSGGGTSGGGSTGGGSTGGGGGSSTGGATSDTTAPSILRHPNITVNATSASGAVQRYVVKATDPDDGADALTIICAPAAGSTFPLGAHKATKRTTVTCHAHDQAHNEATPMSFVVKVIGGHDQIVALERSVNAATRLAPAKKATIHSALVRADHYLRAGQNAKAKATLGTAISQIGALHRPITPAQKANWTSAAARIITVLR